MTNMTAIDLPTLYYAAASQAGRAATIHLSPDCIYLAHSTTLRNPEIASGATLRLCESCAKRWRI